MNKELAKAAIALLVRTDLKGHEAPAWMAVVKALEDIVNTPDQAPLKDAPPNAS